MASMPETPGRGRSRFSKVLPPPPSASVNLVKSPALSTTSTTINSPLPAIPTPNRGLLNPPAVPRRPLGMTAEQRALSAALARAATSPLVTSPPATAPSISRSISEISSSTMDSQSTLESSPPLTPPTPPLPPKDNHARTVKTPEPSSASSRDGFRLQNSSPPRPEIWRRRSNSATFSELQLEKSNGSTATPPRKEAPAPAPTKPLPLPRSNTGSNPPARKPVPIRRDTPPQQQEPPSMGNEVTKLKEKTSTSAKKILHSSSTSRDESFLKRNGPPTPEYVDGPHQEQKNLGTQKVTSPRSPDTPPQETRPRIPPRSDSRTNPPAAKQQPPPPPPPAKELPVMDSYDDSSSTLNALDVIDLYDEPALTSATTQHTATSEETHKGLSSPAAIQSAIFFPAHPGPPIAPDAILPGLPLTETHLSCYQNHKYMRGSRNVSCSVACMVCSKKDHETRWRCTWCCLSACAACMKVLSVVPGKDLSVALGKINGQTVGVTTA